MKKVTDKDYECLQQYRKDLANGKLFTRDLLEFIVKASEYNPTKIGQYFLDIYMQEKTKGEINATDN